MGVRNHVPSSIAFAVTICVRGKCDRVEVMLDLQERLLFVPIRILPDIGAHISSFVEKMAAIAANILAFQKWDGRDSITEYQPIFLLKGYQVDRHQMRFNVILGEPYLLQVGELDQRSEVQLHTK